MGELFGGDDGNDDDGDGSGSINEVIHTHTHSFFYYIKQGNIKMFWKYQP